MRTVTLAIAKLGLSVGDVVEVKLFNSVGKELIDVNGYSFNESITLDADILELELLENYHIYASSTYKIILPSGIKLSFTVPQDTNNTPHDMYSLLSLDCFRELINDDFVAKVNEYLLGNNPHFTKKEKRLMDLYEYYDKEIKDTPSTIDIAQKMDTYLAEVGVL